MSVDMQALYEHVSWCVWHEGLRLYDDGMPGNLRAVNSIRNGCVNLQNHNNYARKLISSASNYELLEVMEAIQKRVEDEHHLFTHFEWVAFHESKRSDFLNLLAEGKFNEIRSIYYNHQNHNTNAKFLLSCVNNAYIENMINKL